MKFITAALLVMSLVFTGCLKTRSQIHKNSKEDAETPAQPPAPPPPAPASRYELEEIKHEVTRISGKLEEIEHNQKVSDSNADNVSKDGLKNLDARVAELEKTQILVLTELKEIKDKQASAREAAINPTQALADGYRLLKEKKYDEASEKFKAVVSKTHNKGTEAAEGQYGIGEVEYAQKNYKKSILAYSKVQEASAKSPKVSQSLYKIGLAFQNLNMKKEARGFFAELVERYPKSAEAKKARARLKE